MTVADVPHLLLPTTPTVTPVVIPPGVVYATRCVRLAMNSAAVAGPLQPLLLLLLLSSSSCRLPVVPRESVTVTGGGPSVNATGTGKYERQRRFNEDIDMRCRPCTCGVGNPGSRVVGGTEAEEREFPWMASLWNARRKFFCGGSVVTDQYVLTAAHCFNDDASNNYREIYVAVGQVKRPYRLFPGEPHVIRASVVKLHHKYDPNGANVHDNDIALVKLTRPMKFDWAVRSICLPTIRYDYGGLTAAVAGWGQLREIGPTSLSLRHATLPLWSEKECTVVPEIAKTGYTANMLCAGLKQGGVDSCQGDSGGPLMIYDNNEKITVAGIVSWGIGCGAPKLPGVYTRVDKYLGWIMRNTKDSCHCSN